MGRAGRTGRLTSALAPRPPDRYLPAIPPPESGISLATRLPAIGPTHRGTGRVVLAEETRLSRDCRFVDLYQHADLEPQPAAWEMRERLGRPAQEQGT